jgi:hypothetical protein
LEQANQAKAERELAKKQEAESKKQKEQEALENDSDLKKLLEGLNEDEDAGKSKNKKPVDQLSNDELLRVFSDVTEKFVDAKIKLDREEREKTQDGFLKKLGNVENMLGSMVAMQSVNDLRNRYPDLNDYKDDISKLIQETPGLSIERAYKLAKAERLDKEPALEHVDTELPDVGPSGLPALRRRPDNKESDENKRSNNNAGLGGFRSLLDAGIARAVANRTRR